MKELHEMEIPGVICLDLSEVMGATHSYEPFNTDTNKKIDAYAEGNPATERIKLCLCRQVLVLPVEGIVNVGEDMEEVNWIKFSKTISDRIHAGKYQVETAKSQNTTSWPTTFLLGSKIKLMS